MARTNPADRRRRDEAALVGIAGGFLADVRRTSPQRIQAAIRGGSIRPITEAPTWRAAHSRAVTQATPVQTDLAAFGLRSGLREVPRTKLVREVPALAPEMGRLRAVELIQGVDGRTRETISVMVRTAGRQYRTAPSLKLLRELAAELRFMIGITPWQRRQVKAKIRALQAAGLSPEAVKRQVIPMIDRFLDIRAKQIADRAVIEDVSAARHRAWELAEDAGELQDPMKAWHDQGDERVRPHHHRQTLMGPIPLRQPYPVFGVQHPPAPEFGCRCWEVLVPDLKMEA